MFIELGIDGLDVQVTFAEIYILRSDLGHLSYTQAGSGQKKAVCISHNYLWQPSREN